MANKIKTALLSTQLQLNGVISQLNGQRGYNPAVIPSHSTVMYKNMLIAKDAAMCANRYIWKNIPNNVTSQELELLFYYNFSIVFFEKNNRLMFAKYGKVGALNMIGQLSKIKPIGFNGKSYPVEYSVVNGYGDVPDGAKDVAIIFNDYSVLPSDNGIPRAVINRDSTIADQVAVFEQMFCNVFLSAKKALALCENDDQRNAIMQEMAAFFDPTKPIISITKRGKTAAIDEVLQMFNFDNNFDVSNHCQLSDYYDKIRRNFDGVPSPDTFEKKERKITSETEDSNTHSDLILLDGYLNRVNKLKLAQKYLDVPGIEKMSVEINPVLKPGASERENAPEDDPEEGGDDVQ